MHRIPDVSRRRFFEYAAAGAALASCANLGASDVADEPAPSAHDSWRGLKVGIATYTFSKLPVDEAIQGARRVGVKYVSIKESHLPLKSTAEQRKAVVQKFRDAGLTALSCGVVNMT